MYSWYRWKPEKASVTLERELQTFVSHNVGAGNPTQELPRLGLGSHHFLRTVMLDALPLSMMRLMVPTKFKRPKCDKNMLLS